MAGEVMEAEAPEAPPVQYERSTGQAVMADQAGEVYTINPDKVADASRMGWRPATEAEFESAKEGAVGTARAAVSGAARTIIPVNVFDPLAVAASRAAYGERGAELARQQLREDEQMHPTATLAGEVAGTLAPLALGIGGGGAGAAIRGEGALARAGQRIVQAAPRAMLEGAGMGIGQQVHEDVLGNHELAAQKYLSSAIKGGLVGLLIGGTVSAGLGAAGDKLASLRAPSAALEAAAEGGPYRSLGKVGENARPSGLMGKLSDFAEEQAAKGAMPSASLAGSELQKLGSTAEAQTTRMRRIGRALLDEGITTPGATKAVQAERLGARVSELGEELGSLRKSLDRSAVRPSVETVMNRINDEVITPLASKPFSAPEVAAVRPYLAEIVGKTGGTLGEDGVVSFKKATFDSFDDLWKLRKALDGKLKWDKGIPPPTAALKELRAIRGILEDEFESAAERAAADLGEDVASKYKVTKALYSDLKTAQKWATKGAARESQNRAISLTDTVMAGAALASGHPMALLAPLANKAVRTYGNQVAATIADRATRIQSVQRAAQAWDTKVDGAVRSFFGHGEPPALGGARTAAKVSPAEVKAIRDVATNPSALADRAASIVASTGLAEDAPRVAQAMTSTIMRLGTWLQGRLPPEPPPRALTFGPAKPRAVGPRAEREIANAVRAVNADAFVDDMARGRIDRQALEALKFINPDAYDDIHQKLVRYGTENQPDLSRQQAVALSIITGKPMTPLMDPKTIKGFQQAYAQDVPPPHDPSAPGMTEKKPVGGQPSPPPGRGQSSRATATNYDKMESGT